MTDTTILGLTFILLLALEWRYRWRVVRVGAAVLAFLVWFLSQPSAYRAARLAMAMPPAERVTQFPGGRHLSEYESGVLTMKRVVSDDIEGSWNISIIPVGVLVWLACSPAFRRNGMRAVAEPAVRETQQVENQGGEAPERSRE